MRTIAYEGAFINCYADKNECTVTGVESIPNTRVFRSIRAAKVAIGKAHRKGDYYSTALAFINSMLHHNSKCFGTEPAIAGTCIHIAWDKNENTTVLEFETLNNNSVIMLTLKVRK